MNKLYLLKEALKDAEKRLKNIDKKDKREIKVALVTYRALERLVAKPFKFDEEDFNLCPVCHVKIETDDKFCWQCGQAVDVELNKNNM